VNETFEKLSFLRFVNSKTESVFAFNLKERMYLDITYCISGELEYIYNGERLVLTSGDAVIFPPHSERTRKEGHTPTHYASFNVILPQDFEIKESGLYKKCISGDTVYLIELFERVWSSVSPLRIERCKGIFHYLYSELLDSASDKENPHINRIKQYIMDNLSGKISIKDIADDVHLAPQYLCTLFKKNTGMTIVEFMDRERIDLAKRLMLISGSPLYEIAERCGFSDYNYFSSIFRKFTGISAREYRKSGISR
jgi:AraC-like DNA-binding protein